MNDEQNNPLEEIAKKAIKTKIKAIAASIAVSLLPFFLGVVVILAFAGMVLLPLAGLFGSEIDIIGGESGGMSKEEQSFSDKLDEKINYWDNRDVEIDSSLVLSIILYQAPFEYSEDCDFDNDDCYGDTRNYRELEKEIDPLIDNMVEEVKIYSCSSQIIEREWVCPSDSNGNPVDDLSLCSYELKEPTYKDPVICGKNSDLCDNICEGEYKISESSVYQLKTEEEYKKWLNEEFLPIKLEKLDIDIPSDSTEKEELFESVNNEIISMRSTVNEESSLVQFFGSNIRSFGAAGPMDPAMLDKLVSPMGDQRCAQTACYGVYGLTKPARHKAVDIGNNGTKPDLFSIYSGEIVRIVRGSGNCYPDFTATPKCGNNCVATQILIEHDIMIEGITRKIYSLYAHLDSVAPGLTVGSTVHIGQFIGVMGNTGCSTAVHLHFEIWDEQRRTHNPEELLNKVSCQMIPTCELARERHL